MAAKIELVSGKGVTQGAKALKIDFQANAGKTGIEIKPAQPWDCRPLGQYRLSFDATNTGTLSVHLAATVQAENGGQQSRSVSVPAGETHTFYFELMGDGLSEDLGMRDDPASLPGCGRKMIVKGLKQPAYFPDVASITLFTEDLLAPKELVLDNMQLVSNPPIDPNYLKGIVDGYGQNAKVDFPGKVYKDEQLRKLADDEVKALGTPGPMEGRGKFGGWKDGPKQEASGYFRTEKIGGKWALVDPEGYLYFATGIANIRMTDNATYTGYALKDASKRALFGAANDPTGNRHVTNAQRQQMFTWLPGPDSSLAKYYDYRWQSHMGPIKQGEVFSFYNANLERRYGGGDQLAKWREVTLNRMLDWGFTSLGNWTDPTFYQNQRIPYFANGWTRGKFKTVSSGYDYWGPIPDPYDPDFVSAAKSTAAGVAKEVNNSPWCVGIFIDNEMSWGSMSSPKSQFGVVLTALSNPATESPAKARFMTLLRGNYASIDALNKAWQTSIASWDALAQGIDLREKPFNAATLPDFANLLEDYASEYYKVVHDALEEVMPNHLYLGSRLTTWGMTPEVWKGARKHCDVVSYNSYSEGLDEKTWSFLKEVDKPSIIGEFHFGSTDTGCFNPGIIHSANLADRAVMWRAYMDSVVENPHLVGAHWFQYIDSPLTGRSYDGENYNVGFVRVTDVPYQDLVDASKNFHRTLYSNRYGKAKPKP